MIKFGFKLVSLFWMLSPVAFLVGRAMGHWNTKGDWLIFLFLMGMSGLSLFLNYNPDEA